MFQTALAVASVVATAILLVCLFVFALQSWLTLMLVTVIYFIPMALIIRKGVRRADSLSGPK